MSASRDLGAQAVIAFDIGLRFAAQDPDKAWLLQLKERKRPKVVAVAQANKTARIA